MRTGHICGIAALGAAILLALPPLAGAQRHDEGPGSQQPAPRALLGRPGGPSPVQRALDACQARGADGAALQRCAELVLAGSPPALAVRIASAALEGITQDRGGSQDKGGGQGGQDRGGGQDKGGGQDRGGSQDKGGSQGGQDRGGGQDKGGGQGQGQNQGQGAQGQGTQPQPASQSGGGQGQGGGGQGGQQQGGGQGQGGGGGQGQQPAPTTQRTAANPQRPGSTTPARPVTTSARASAPQPSGPVISDRGIVQATGSDGVVLRALDGSSIVIPVDVLTRVYLGDAQASLGDVRPGVVATVRHRSGGTAIDIRVALAPKPKLRTDRGIVVNANPTLVVVQLRDGTSVSIAVSPPSTVVVAPNGARLSPGDIRPGFLVDITYDPAGTVPAQTVKIIRRVS